MGIGVKGFGVLVVLIGALITERIKGLKPTRLSFRQRFFEVAFRVESFEASRPLEIRRKFIRLPLVA